MADRFTYVPSVGLFIMIVWGVALAIGDRPRLRSLSVAAACASLLILAFLARAQLRTWSDSRSVWNHALSVNPANWLAHENLGTLTLREGDSAGAEAHLREAVRLNPGNPQTHYNLGVLLKQTGRMDEAVASFRTSISIDPTMADAHNNLGGTLASMGRTADAVEELRAAVHLSPSQRLPHINLASLLVAMRRDAEAVPEYSEALRLTPNDPDTLDKLSLVLIRLERWTEAIDRLQQLVRLRPRAEVHSSLGYCFARSGKMREALAEFEETLRLDPNDTEAAANAAEARRLLGQGTSP